MDSTAPRPQPPSRGHEAIAYTGLPDTGLTASIIRQILPGRCLFIGTKAMSDGAALGEVTDSGEYEASTITTLWHFGLHQPGFLFIRVPLRKDFTPAEQLHHRVPAQCPALPGELLVIKSIQPRLRRGSISNHRRANF
jgi:hypothetical protein